MHRMWRKYNPVVSYVSGLVWDVPCPVNLSIFWNFGSLLGFALVLQIVTGFVLAMHYSPEGDRAFWSVWYIVRRVNGGWAFRGLHVYGSTMFFMFMYVHIARGVYFCCYTSKVVWFTGIVLYFMVSITAVLGYMLPWGNMSYWAATVIANMITAVPYIGVSLFQWIVGYWVVTSLVLKRFFVLHMFLPFVVVLMVMVHLHFLHQSGSHDEFGMQDGGHMVPFHPYYTSKDLVGVSLAFFFLALGVCFYPNVFLDKENFSQIDLDKSPINIKPEWYFYWLYVVVRAVPHKGLGLLGMVFMVLILGLLPFINTGKLSALAFYPVHQMLFWAWVCSWVVLSWLGQKPAEEFWVWFGQSACKMYVFLFFVNPLTMWVWDWLIK